MCAAPPRGLTVTEIAPGVDLQRDILERSDFPLLVSDDLTLMSEHLLRCTLPGDPAKAAKAIIAAVESDAPLAFLLLAKDALSVYRQLAASRLDTIELGSTSPQALTSTPELNH
jgi:hypothetical protein